MLKKRLIIAGGRDFNDYSLLETEINSFLIENNLDKDNCAIVSGHAKGADELGELFARRNGFELLLFKANWTLYGKSAGMFRNVQMAKNSTHCLAFWDGQSRGTKHMIDMAKKYGITHRVTRY